MKKFTKSSAMSTQNAMNIRRNRKGFTLIELIVVIAILAILAAIAIPAFTGTLTNAKVKADTATVQSIQTAVRLYQAENNALPTGAQVLTYIDGGTVGTPAQGSTFKFYYNPTTGAVVCASAAPTGSAALA